MTSTALPTILLIPGAFTSPACYDWLAPVLEKERYPIVRASLSSTRTVAREADLLTDAEQEGLNLLHQYVLPLIDQQAKDVVIFAHSFGATCLAGQKYSKKARLAEGKEGGVLGLVYLSCALPKAGQSQLNYLGGVWPDFCKRDWPQKGLLVFEPAAELLYGDVEDKDLKRRLAEGHMPQSMKVFVTEVGMPMWEDVGFEGRRIMVVTKQDQTFPAVAQKSFVEGSGVKWEVQEVDGGHCAFISRADDVAKIVIDAAERWM